MSQEISIHNLAVLRAAAEGKPAGTYFYSHATLGYWIGNTESHGLINEAGKATEVGGALAARLDLVGQEKCRATNWFKASALTVQARAFMAENRREEA